MGGDLAMLFEPPTLACNVVALLLAERRVGVSPGPAAADRHASEEGIDQAGAQAKPGGSMPEESGDRAVGRQEGYDSHAGADRTMPEPLQQRLDGLFAMLGVDQGRSKGAVIVGHAESQAQRQSPACARRAKSEETNQPRGAGIGAPDCRQLEALRVGELGEGGQGEGRGHEGVGLDCPDGEIEPGIAKAPDIAALDDLDDIADGFPRLDRQFRDGVCEWPEFDKIRRVGGELRDRHRFPPVQLGVPNQDAR